MSLQPRGGGQRGLEGMEMGWVGTSHAWSSGAVGQYGLEGMEVGLG